MTPDLTILQGDCREKLRELPDASVNCCVTSPPYFGLRDYNVAGQIGLEPTPDEYVAELVDVFREVRRVLRDDGTLWLNLGDSYAGSWGNYGGKNRSAGTQRVIRNGSQCHQKAYDGLEGWRPPTSGKLGPGLKPKDLIGIPWAVAKALRDPYYAGRIKAERDRAWLAAMIDGEGTICGFNHTRKDDGRVRTGINICVTNSSIPLLDECFRIWPVSRNEHNFHGDGHLGSLPTYRWIVHGVENKLLFLRELYPYLIAKKRQCLLAYNLLLFSAQAKKIGKTPQKDEVNEIRALLVSLISDANNNKTCDIPDWCIEPPSVLEDAWYLRQDIIWAKPNPMPESVEDRCTKAHEYLFLLSKSDRYFYDQDAIKEIGKDPLDDLRRISKATLNGKSTPDEERNGIRRKVKVPGGWDTAQGAHGTIHRSGRTSAEYQEAISDGKRNKRSVWTVPTSPFPEAHFATYPPDLIKPCVLAGCPAGGVCLDPFAGSGTTGKVALENGRSAILIELNPEYVKLIEKRCRVNLPLMFEQGAA